MGFCGKCHLHGGIMHMKAIGDKAAIAVMVRKGSPYHAGLAAIQLAHGIEEMGESLRARGQGFCNFGKICLGMAETDEHPLSRQAI